MTIFKFRCVLTLVCLATLSATATAEDAGLHTFNRKTPPCQLRAVTSVAGGDIMLVENFR